MPYTPQQRALIFWLGCIPTRTALTLYARKHGRDARALRLFATAIALRWLSGAQVGNETYFGGVAWWADERPLHGLLWLSYAVSADWRWLAGDTAVGSLNWAVNNLI